MRSSAAIYRLVEGIRLSQEKTIMVGVMIVVVINEGLEIPDLDLFVSILTFYQGV